MTAQKISAWIGVVLAAIGIPLKILRVMRESEPLPFMAYDFIALALVLAGAVIVLRRGSGRLLAAGWGFGCAMFYGSFFGHFEKWTQGTGNAGFERTMVVSTGLFLVLNVVGLLLALIKPR
ncbi:MAG TPA: hypothetical protein VG387_13115 [Rhizomicrobium sp.]|jgi:uncharacterized membrane protein required for colicin V production|nr:hypothetical protein [Rhizomicrobium sp.]